MNLKQSLEKIDFSFDSPLDPSLKVKVHKNPNHIEMTSAKHNSTFNELCGLLLGNTYCICVRC